MPRTTIIYILIAVAAIVILYFLFGREEAAAAPSITGAGAGVGSVGAGSPLIAQLGEILEEPPTEKCGRRCRQICKGHPRKGRRKFCIRPCKSDCAKGLDIGSIYP